MSTYLGLIWYINEFSSLEVKGFCRSDMWHLLTQADRMDGRGGKRNPEKNRAFWSKLKK